MAASGEGLLAAEAGFRRFPSGESEGRDAVHRSVEILEGRRVGKTSMFTSMCLLVQSIVGGGLLTFPHAYKLGGVVNVLVLQLLLLPFITLGLWVLAWCTERTTASTYQAMVRQSLGRRAEALCVWVIVILIFGASVAYLDILVDQTLPWFQHLEKACAADRGPICAVAALRLHDRSNLTAVVAIFLTVLCLGRSMASLSLPSLLGFVALLYVCFAIMANFAAGRAAGLGPAAASGTKDAEAEGVAWCRSGLREWLSTIPVICFSYQGHISAVPVYAELHYRSTSRWMKVIAMGLGACIVLYNATGLLGYLQFLEKTDSDILKSFLEHPDAVNIPGGFMVVGHIAVAMAVAVTCAVFTFCARSAILDELHRLCGCNIESSAVFYGMTCLWMAAVAAVASCVPDMGAVVSVIGNFSAFFMFQFPGLCLLAAADEDNEAESRPDAGNAKGKMPRSISLRLINAGDGLNRRGACLRVLGWTFVVLGTVVFVLGLASAFYST